MVGLVASGRRRVHGVRGSRGSRVASRIPPRRGRHVTPDHRPDAEPRSTHVRLSQRHQGVVFAWIGHLATSCQLSRSELSPPRLTSIVTSTAPRRATRPASRRLRMSATTTGGSRFPDAILEHPRSSTPNPPRMTSRRPRIIHGATNGSVLRKRNLQRTHSARAPPAQPAVCALLRRR